MAKTKAELQSELQTEALHYIGDRSGIAVEIGTGGGKTLLGLKHMGQRYTDTMSFCVAAPTKKIMEAWKNEIALHGYEYLLSSITFTTYRSLKKQDLRHDWLYLDECHSLKESHAEWLDSYEINGGKILGLTGTYPTGNHSEKARMCNQFCPKIFEYHVDEAIDNGMLNNYKIFVHMLKLDKKRRWVKKKGKGNREWFTTEQADYDYWEKAMHGASNPGQVQMLRILRMKALQAYPTKVEYVKTILGKIQEKTLVFANTKEQADNLCSHSCHSSNPKSDENLELFRQGKIYRLSCIDQLSEGANIADLKVGIIMHSFSNERKARQKIGRFLRLSPEETAIIHILCFEDSIDLHWVRNALKSFNQSKIKIYRPK
jgi:superfamily II DNA or RNA helicase